MIDAGSPKPRRMLLLAALEAAKRFSPRPVRAGAPRDGWRPVVLRWKRARKYLRDSRTNRVALPANVRVFPRFYFSSTTFVTDRSRRAGSSGGLFSAAQITGGRIVMDQNRNNVRKLGTPLTPARMPSAKAVILQPNILTSNARPQLRDPGEASRFSITQLIATTSCARRRMRLERPSITGRMTKTGQRPSQTPQKPSRFFFHSIHQFSRRPGTPQDNALRRVADRKPVEWKIDRPEELLWRRADRPSASIEENAARNHQTSDSVHRASVRSDAGRETSEILSPAFTQPQAMQITKLDPVLVDRLTDDVIRKVEKRMRIERERRGL